VSGADVIGADTRAHGFSPGLAARLRLLGVHDDGQRVALVYEDDEGPPPDHAVAY
jgi:hypothetical protein